MYRTFGEVKAQLSTGKSVVSIVQDYLAEIDKQKGLNAFLEVFTDSALEQARQVDEKYNRVLPENWQEWSSD